ncbi:MAG: secretin N-terminal domain-containing protein [Planctomycetota bacterium]|nr:secretin N-terminal domain-containing protein [Planctomycetota bacterium]
MNSRTPFHLLIALATSSSVLVAARAQDGGLADGVREGAAAVDTNRDDLGRGDDPLTGTRPELGDDLVPVNFKEKSLEDFIPLIVSYTGKSVITKTQAPISTKISIQSERLVPKHEALNLIFQAFRLNGIGVVETTDMIMIDSLTSELNNFQPGLILGPEVDVSQMDEDGQIVTKVFRLRHAKAAEVESQIDAYRPTYASVSSDVNSNQIIIEGDVAWAKRVQKLLDLLDVEPFLAVRTETFRLAYADAQTIADIVLELFSPNPNSGGSRTSNARNTATRGRPQPNQGNQALPQVGTSDQLQVSVLPQTNSVTVRAEPEILTDIRFLIETAWDVPPSREGTIFRLYDLRYTDPVKVKNLLGTLLETGSGGGGGRPAGRGGGNAAAGGADAAVADIFRIEAYPDSNRLVVISKTPDNFEWLDSMIEQIDQPLSVGLPVNVELKHASAIDVADILNTLLAQAGGGGRGIRLPEEGLSGINFADAGGGEGGTTGTTQENEEITFPWQSGRGNSGDEAAEVSALVGKSRVVPNPGQNSLLVLATPEIQDAVLGIIEDLDRPGRQVMITATLAEVTLSDGLDLGLRVGTNLVASGDNSFGGSVALDLNKGTDTIQGLGDNFASPWFDTSVLDVQSGASFVLSALAENNNVRILQRPRVFTSDNREAKFFSGQDVTFQTGQTANETGTTTSFEQESIGIGLNIRPRITKERNVALEIEVLLSSLSGATTFDNPIVNRRQTTTAVTIKNNQTIVISGIRKEDDTDVVRKVPLLGDIPVLGALFSSTTKSKAVSEFLIFVTPVVVDNPDENDTNFNAEDIRRLDDLSKPLDQMSRDLVDTAFFDRMETDDDDENPNSNGRKSDQDDG